MNQYMITGGGDNYNYGVLPPLFNKFQEMAGGAMTDSEHMNHVAIPMTLLSMGGERTKKRDYEEINRDEVIQDDLYDKLLELLHVKNTKKTSRKKRQHMKDSESTEVKKRNTTRKNI
jgi:hypothetical protein